MIHYAMYLIGLFLTTFVVGAFLGKLHKQSKDGQFDRHVAQAINLANSKK